MIKKISFVQYWAVVLLLLLSSPTTSAQLFLGTFRTRSHLTAGNLYLLNERALEIRDFVYDGLGPAAFFWIDKSSTPSPNGQVAADGSPANGCAMSINDSPLPRAQQTTQRVELPEGMTINDFLGGSLSVWCERFNANFGEVVLPNSIDDGDIPSPGPDLECFENTGVGVVDNTEPVFLDSFRTRQHLVAGDLYVVSERVLEIRNYVYDGFGPAAFFWMDTSATPTRNGRVVPDASPSLGCAMDSNAVPLPPANGDVTQYVELPEGMTIRDYAGGSLSVWCEAFSANFGEAVIPMDVDIPNVDDMLECFENNGGDGGDGMDDLPDIVKTPDGFNCEPLSDDYQVRWQIAGDTLNVELVGRIDDGTYMGFGLSGRPQTETWMIGADAVVADMSESGPRVQDVFLDARAQCNGVAGACPDSVGGYTNDVSDVSAEQDFGITLIRYKRPLVPTDDGVLTSRQELVDMAIPTTAGIDTYIVWALGPISNVGNPLFHSDYARNNNGPSVSLDFGRAIADNCTPLATDEPDTEPPLPPFERPELGDPDGITTFDCHIGPSGGLDRGYQAITGQPSWGIAWYLNGYLIPKLILRRGATYTFRVNGGDIPIDDANYHPFYLTDSPVGGYFQLTPSERKDETAYAGIRISDSDTVGVYDFEPTAIAPICEYEVTSDTATALSGSFGDYFASLDSSCASDQALLADAAILTFTPDDSTPDKIYYHCVTHRNLGFEIEVVGRAPRPMEGFEVQALTGQLAGAELHYRVNIADPAASGQDTITIILETPALGWVGFAFNDNGGSMVGSEAVIGLPDTGEVLKYDLDFRAVAGIVPMEDARQTLIDASISQTNFGTTLTFTKILVEEGEIPIEKDAVNTFLSAWGFSNTLAFHEAREPVELFVVVPTAAPSEVPTDLPSSPPTAFPTRTPTKSPTPFPSIVPSSQPTGSPTKSPTSSPSTAMPTLSPITPMPVVGPTTTPPTTTPTRSPTQAPTTTAPTFPPVTPGPTQSISASPTTSPSQGPTTKAPTLSPSQYPSTRPTESPIATSPPTQAPTDLPTTSAPTTSDSDGDLETIALQGPLEGAMLQYRINIEDPAAWGQDTLTVILEVPTAGWVGFAFNDNGGTMVGSEAVIGLPNTGEVKKYNLNQRVAAGVVPMADSRQTLINPSITQESGTTTLTFTKILVEEGEILIEKNGINTFLSAWGSSNFLGFHAASFAYDLTFVAPSPATSGPTKLPTAAPIPESESPSESPSTSVPTLMDTKGDSESPSGTPSTVPPTEAPTIFPSTSVPTASTADGVLETVELSGQLEGAILQYRINLEDPAAAGQDTLTVVLEVPAVGWVGFAFNDNGGTMVGSEAVIGLPDSGKVLKYDLNQRATAGIVPMADERQTLINASISQTSNNTTLTFTKILVEEGEIAIEKNDTNKFLSAWGSSNILGVHIAREPYDVFLIAPSDPTPSPTLSPSLLPSLSPSLSPSLLPSLLPSLSPIVTDDDTEFEAVVLGGQLEGATMKYRINEAMTEGSGRALAEDTITVILEVPAVGWVGFAFNDNGGTMVGSEAVIGLPDTGKVLKYNLNQQETSGVVPMADERQTLIDASIIQTDETTTLTFTKILVEEGEIPIQKDVNNTFLSAWGSNNVLGFHAAREPYDVMVLSPPNTTLAPVAPTPAPANETGNMTLAPVEPSQAPTQTMPTPVPTMLDEFEGFESIALTDQLEGATLRYLVNLQDPAASGQGTLTVILETPAIGWVGFAFNDNGGKMVGSEAVIGLPGTGEVKKYSLNEQSTSSVVPMPDERQTLINTSITQHMDGTTLKFTKLLVEEGEIEIVPDEVNSFLSAWGSSNVLGFHAAREPYEVLLLASGDEDDDPFDVVMLPGRLEGAILSYRVNEADPVANGQDTITVFLETPAEGWVGVAFNNGDGKMVGSEAVIGLPDTNEVQKYNLNQQGVAGVVPMAPGRQTLIDVDISQTPDGTTLKFTKILVEEGEIAIQKDAPNTFLSAWGSSNNLSFHAAYDPFTVSLTTTRSAASVPSLPPASDEPSDPEQESAAYRHGSLFVLLLSGLAVLVGIQ